MEREEITIQREEPANVVPVGTWAGIFLLVVIFIVVVVVIKMIQDS